MANPYYVQPMHDISQGLSGISEVLKKGRQEKKALADKNTAQSEIQAAYDSKDADVIAKTVLKYPQYKDVIGSALGVRKEGDEEATTRKTKSASSFIRNILAAKPEERDSLYRERIQSVSEDGDADPTDSLNSYKDWQENPESEIKDLELLYAGIAPEEYKAYKGIYGKSGGLASAKTEILDDGLVVSLMPNGDVQVKTADNELIEGQAANDAIKRSKQFSIDQKQKLSNIAIAEARDKAGATNRESRVSSLRTEMSERNRTASREQVGLNRALTLASKATQGVRGSLKLQMAKLFPDIDASDEAALDQALTSLALDQLQKFKGPTTDFEYGVTENIVGSVGDSRSSNISKLNSLKRAAWFNKREVEQFNKFIKKGGDPDEFGFNFSETVQTSRGPVSLQDLQVTAVDRNISIEEVISLINKKAAK